MEILNWIQNWYMQNCDGDWEHSYGITIETLDNPGWSVSINLEGTSLENFEMEHSLVEKSSTDWYSYEIKNQVYNGFGDPQKLIVLLEKFREICLSNVLK